MGELLVVVLVVLVVTILVAALVVWALLGRPRRDADADRRRPSVWNDSGDTDPCGGRGRRRP